MKCSKCSGFMINQTFSNQFLKIEGWKCVNCGKIIEKKENSVKDTSFNLFYQKEKVKRKV